MMTLAHYLIKGLNDHPDRLDLTLIMSDLATVGKFLSREINRAGIADIRGAAGSINIQNEQVQKLDVVANALCKDYLRATGHFAALASEEEDAVVDMGTSGSTAQYVIAFDPLDGSTNIDTNASIGTIFSVLRLRQDVPRTDERQFFQTGRAQVLAGYLLYGSSTLLVFSYGDGVHEFTLDQGLGEFLLSNDRMMMPAECPFYSTNEGNEPYISEKDKKFIHSLKYDKKCSTRYIGTLAADVHRTLARGGIFMYPGIDKTGMGVYKGKLRLNYEVKPLAFLVEQAGGRAIDGVQDILDIVPIALHQRVPVILGNKNVIDSYL